MADIVFFLLNPFHMAVACAILASIHVLRLTDTGGLKSNRWATISRIVTYYCLSFLFVILGLDVLPILDFRALARIIVFTTVITEIFVYMYIPIDLYRNRKIKRE